MSNVSLRTNAFEWGIKLSSIFKNQKHVERTIFKSCLLTGSIAKQDGSDFQQRRANSVQPSFSFLTHYRNASIEKRRPWKLGYPLGFGSSNKVSKTTAIFRCRQNSERRIFNFSVWHLWADNTDTIEGLTIVLKCRNAGFIGKGFRAWST